MKTPKTDKELFVMANEIHFSLAIDKAKDFTRPLQREPFRTIGDRIHLIDEIEKAGYTITKDPTLPQTDFTRIIPVTVYDAKQFIGRIETQISICETCNLSSEANVLRELNKAAHGLFKIPYNATDSKAQAKIREGYSKHLDTVHDKMIEDSFRDK